MTRKTFHTVIAGIALSAAAASPNASAYFAVSVPGSAITMSGVRHEVPTTVAPTEAAAPKATPERQTRADEARQVKRSLLRALFLPAL
jgi:hypothetical protein